VTVARGKEVVKAENPGGKKIFDHQKEDHIVFDDESKERAPLQASHHRPFACRQQ
jgi:hypothetical protein